jgi:hypothetical protein
VGKGQTADSGLHSTPDDSIRLASSGVSCFPVIWFSVMCFAICFCDVNSLLASALEEESAFLFKCMSKEDRISSEYIDYKQLDHARIKALYVKNQAFGIPPS